MPGKDDYINDDLDYVALTDIGMRRSNNQDAHSVVLADDEESWKQRGHVFMVADGMGAHAAGELASKLAAEGVPHLYFKYSQLSPPEALEQAIVETNAEVNRKGQANPDFHKMGTTISVLILLPQGALVAHVGDSRISRLPRGALEQLTFDHSLVWELRAAGQLNAESDVALGVPKNVITRSLGPYENVQIDVEGPFPVENGDTFLLCSDGLTGEVADDELGPLLSNLSPAEAARVLVDLANLRGGADNVTVIVAKVVGDGLSTRVASDSPLVIGKSKQGVTVHPVYWIVAAVGVIAAVVLGITGQLIPAGLAAAIAAAAVALGHWRRRLGEKKGVALGAGRKLGKGPYTKTTCLAQHSFVDKLSGTVAELRDAAIEQEWNVDFATFDEHARQAEVAAGHGRHSDAVRHYAHALSFMMQELRDRIRRKSSDSTIDY